jgi:hypothetical protein
LVLPAAGLILAFIKMKCEELQVNLALFLDDSLSKGESSIIEEHLPACPLCRQSLADMQAIRHGLHSLPRPPIPHSVLSSVRLSLRLRTDQGTAPFSLLNTGFRGQQYRVWLLSYAVSVFASIILGFSFLWLILIANVGNGRSNLADTGKSPSRSPVILASGIPNLDRGTLILSAKDFANTRSDIASVSPSVNPQGSLIELTKSLVKGEIRDDEVVVVADVYGDGSAQITEVVEPSRNQNAVTELARALDYETVNAPFVPATFDQRSDTIRVVLKIQSVDVSTKERARKRRSL